MPWHFHRERKGAVLKWVDVRDDGSFDIDAFAAAITDRTKMVAITHMSNVLGTVTPIKEIVEIAHARNIPVLVDGSQGAVHLKVDVQDLGVDFYVATGHKLYGPTGIGFLYGRAEHLAGMRPYQGGGEMIDIVTLDAVTYNDPPHRFEAGTPPIVQAVGLGAAIDYVDALGRDHVAAHEAEVTAYATDRLILVGEVLGRPSEVALKLSEDYLSIEPYALMMRRDADLRLAVNRALAQTYRSGEIIEVFRQSFPAGARPSALVEAAYVLNALSE